MNSATETVAVTGAELDATGLMAAVEAIGYGLTATDGAAGAGEPAESVARSNSWLPRVIAGAVFGRWGDLVFTQDRR